MKTRRQNNTMKVIYNFNNNLHLPTTCTLVLVLLVSLSYLSTLTEAFLPNHLISTSTRTRTRTRAYKSQSQSIQKYEQNKERLLVSPFSIHTHTTMSLAATSAPTPAPALAAEPQTQLQEEKALSDITSSAPEKFAPLFTKAYETTLPKEADNTKNAHDPFRFEWGTWVDNESIMELMERVDEVRAAPGAFDTLMSMSMSMSPTDLDGEGVKDDRDRDRDGDHGDEKKKKETETRSRRIKIASGKKWDCIVHVLSSNTQVDHRWPTGSWSIVKALTGVIEVAMLKEDRDGNKTKRTKKDLRGGSDGNFGVGGGASIGGADCIKYVGGPLRSYMGKSERCILFEIVVRPPISVEDSDSVEKQFDLANLEDVLDIFIPEPEEDEEKNDEEESCEDGVEEDATVTSQQQVENLGDKLGMNFDAVGGLDAQLDTIVRRVLASRANPEAARRLGISHVKGILLSGPPGCGKTLLARELARLLGAREPQIVNGPEILDKFIGEAEKRVRDLFMPAEMEYAQVGDDSALHIIILDEMDAIARKRGSASSDTTGVRDSVVNQLLAKMDGVKQANNVLVVGLTNRPELLDPALLRPGRLEVQLRVELPDAGGRRDIFRIHTRQMREAGGLSKPAEDMIENLSDSGLAAQSEKFTGAEIAGLVRSAASFALARSVQQLDKEGDGSLDFLDSEEGKVSIADFNQALKEVRPSLGKQDSLLQMRFARGVSPCSPAMQRVMRDLKRFTAPVDSQAARLNSLLLVGSGGNGGAGVTALAAWVAAEASAADTADYVRFVTALDLLAGEGTGGEGTRAAALIDKFSEAREMPNSLLVLDDIDQLCAGSGPGGYSSVMIATLRALLRTPPESSSAAKAGGQSLSKSERGRSMHIIATTSRSDAACVTLHDLFEETIVVQLLTEATDITNVLKDAGFGEKSLEMASLMVEMMGPSGFGVKTILRLGDRAVATASQTRGLISTDVDTEKELECTIVIEALRDILEDMRGDELTASSLCEIVY